MNKINSNSENTNTLLAAGARLDKQIGLTEFVCKICGKKILFDSSNPNSYLSKSPHEKFFGMQLTTFRVPHNNSAQRHVNTILVDHKGFFRGHIDCYIDLKQEETYIVDAVLHPLALKDGKPLRNHTFFDTFFVFDRTKLWVLDLICPSNIKALDLTEHLLREIQNALTIYTDLPHLMTIRIADKQFHLWILGSIAVVVSLRGGMTLSTNMSELLSKITYLYADDEASTPNRRTLLVAVNAITRLNLSIDHYPLIKRVLTDPILFTIIGLKYPENIPRIVNRLTKYFTLPKEIMFSLLNGRIAIINLLDSIYFVEILELIEFVDRRNLTS